MGFGRKDVRANDLRKLTIIGAMRLYERELALDGHPLDYNEIVTLVKRAMKKQGMVLNETEFQGVVNGAVQLAKNRRYVGEIADRWSSGRTSLGYDDLRRAGELLDDTKQKNTARGRGN